MRRKPIHGGRVRPTAFVFVAVCADSRMESRSSATTAGSFCRSRFNKRSDPVRPGVPSLRHTDSAPSLPLPRARHSTPILTRVVTKPQSPITHEPVLAPQLVQALVTDRGGTYLDVTFGRGGHTRAILAELNDTGRLVGLDRDRDAAQDARELEQQDARFSFSCSKFSELRDVLNELDIPKVDGICFDVGVSTPQLKDAERGFAFDIDGPLDMRMDGETGLPASEWINKASIEDLSEVLRTYGDVRNARSIARQIVARRPLATTFELVSAIRAATPGSATSARILAQVFQAVRIHVNDELNELQNGLVQGFDALNVGGRLAVISFHSIEHRLVRDVIQSWVRPPVPKGLPVRSKDEDSRARHVVKNVRPAYIERQNNPASRSAMMQVVERLR